MPVRRPFGELDLGDQLRFKPYTVFHLFFRQGQDGMNFCIVSISSSKLIGF
jgi:hypothetical protein